MIEVNLSSNSRMVFAYREVDVKQGKGSNHLYHHVIKKLSTFLGLVSMNHTFIT